MSIGLDLGSTQFRSLRYQGDRLVGRTCNVETVSVPDTPAHRRLLVRDRVPFADCQGTLHILGDAAREWSRLLSVPRRRLLPDGQLPQDDAIARQILSLVVDSVLPVARIPNELCSLTIPGELLPAETSPERDFFLRLVRLRGYRPEVIGQGHAVALAAMGTSGYSGLGIAIGASLCEFSLMNSGRELARCAIPWGVEEIRDELSAAGSLEHDTGSWSPDIQRLVSDFLVNILLEAGSRIEQNRGFQVLTQPVAIVAAGSLTSQPGFQDVFEKAWERAAWPMRVRSISLGGDSDFTIARGCLIRAVLESQSESLQFAA